MTFILAAVLFAAMPAVGALCITVVASGLVNATLPRFLTEVGMSAGAYGYGFGAIAGAIRVERADTGLLGRAFGLTDATVRTAMLGSIALAPLANELVAPDAILLAGAAVLSVAGLVALAGVSTGRSGRRSLRLRRPTPARSST